VRSFLRANPPSLAPDVLPSPVSNLCQPASRESEQISIGITCIIYWPPHIPAFITHHKADADAGEREHVNCLFAFSQFNSYNSSAPFSHTVNSRWGYNSPFFTLGGRRRSLLLSLPYSQFTLQKSQEHDRHGPGASYQPSSSPHHQALLLLEPGSDLPASILQPLPLLFGSSRACIQRVSSKWTFPNTR